MTDAPASDGLRAAKITALFCAVASALYTLADAEPSPIVVLFFSAAPLFAVILWLERDAHKTGVGAVHDLGFFLWFAWLVVIPWYSWRTRGSRGWRLCLGLFALIGSAYIAAILVYAIRYYAQ
jgi:hypothetical protein